MEYSINSLRVLLASGPHQVRLLTLDPIVWRRLLLLTYLKLLAGEAQGQVFIIRLTLRKVCTARGLCLESA